MKEEHTRTREERNGPARGEEGKREAREGGGMLRSRGNRLPRERVSLPLSSLSSPHHLVVSRRPRLPPLVLSHRRPRNPLSPPVAVVEDLSSRFLLLRVSPARGRGSPEQERFPSFISSILVVFIVLWISTPPSNIVRCSSVIAATGVRAHKRAHIRAKAHCSRGEPRLFSTAIPRRFHSDPP